MPLLIGIDLGTTGCKAAIYDDQGAALGESYLEYGLITRSATMIEQDPCAWWELTCRAVREALTAARAGGREKCAVAVSSQGISFVPVDSAGQPIGNAINWLDTRAVDECAQILALFPERELFQLTGKRASPSYVLPKLLWLRSHEPERWQATAVVLMGHDYLVNRMCGAWVTDHSMAGGTLLYDLTAQDWSDRLLAATGLRRALLPAIGWAGSAVGELGAGAADELGLPQGTVVVLGGQDQKCAALGAGITDGAATLSLGTASAIEQIAGRPLFDPAMRIPVFAFVQSGRWVLEGVIGTSAGSLRWYRDTIAGGMPYDRLDAEAGKVAPGAGGVIFLPHLSGAYSPHWQSAARGTFHGLSLATSRGHLTRALLEGVAYQLRQNLDVTQELAGPAREAILFGGGAKSPLWRQIITDVIGRPVAWTPTVETASLGAAMLAGVGCGAFASLAEARAAMVKTLPAEAPDPARSSFYAEAFERYCAVERSLLAGLAR